MSRCIRRPRIVVVGAASCLALLSSEAAAQDDSTRVRAVGVRAAIGTTLDRYSTFGTESGPLGVLGLQWQRPGSKLSGRLELSGQWQRSRWAPFVFSCSEGCHSESERRLLGLSFDGQYDVTRSAVRPYILSGIGLYHVSQRSRQNFTCAPSEPPDPPACTPLGEMRTIWNAGTLDIELHAGAGLSIAVGRATLFGEARYSVLSGDGSTDDWRMPVLVGVRF